MVVLFTTVMTETEILCVRVFRACVCACTSACLFVVVQFIFSRKHSQPIDPCAVFVCVCAFGNKHSQTQQTPDRRQKLITFRSMQYEGERHACVFLCVTNACLMMCVDAR